MHRIIRTLVAAVVILSAPTAAMAVNVVSYWGNGTQARTASYVNGAKVSGKLSSPQSQRLYFEGKLSYPGLAFCAQGEVGRYSGFTSSKTPVTMGGTISKNLGLVKCSGAKVQSRVSRQLDWLPDPSGLWSSKY